MSDVVELPIVRPIYAPLKYKNGRSYCGHCGSRKHLEWKTMLASADGSSMEFAVCRSCGCIGADASQALTLIRVGLMPVVKEPDRCLDCNEVMDKVQAWTYVSPDRKTVLRGICEKCYNIRMPTKQGPQLVVDPQHAEPQKNEAQR